MPFFTTPPAPVRRRLSPSKRMSPESGVYRRVMTLNAVVFPAPFGPIRPTISPTATSSDTPSSATMPPKRLLTLSTSRRGTGGLPCGGDQERHHRRGPLRSRTAAFGDCARAPRRLGGRHAELRASPGGRRRGARSPRGVYRV